MKVKGTAMHCLLRGAAAILPGLLIAYSAHAQAPVYDLVLRNGRVIDGTGSPWYYADVAIKGDAIVRIARSIAEPATRVIDVGGQIIAPGFIDIHSHARRGIFEVPSADNYLHQGVTPSSKDRTAARRSPLLPSSPGSIR